MNLKSLIFGLVILAVIGIGAGYNPFDSQSIGKGVNKKKIIDEFLIVELTDRTYDVNSLTPVVLTNRSEKYTFQLSKIGIKYKTTFGKTAYTYPAVNVNIPPGDSKSLEVSIPRGIKPQVGFGILDDVKIKKKGIFD